MSIADGQAEDGGEALDREAAHWFARMRSPDADESRAAFEAWLAQGPEHRAAYNRAAEIFAMGKLLAEPEPDSGSAPRHRGTRAAAFATIAACVLGVGGWLVWHPGDPASDPQAVVASAGPQTITTIAGESRVVRLVDGSTVRLASNTALEVDIGSTRRSLNLLRGKARFEVAHEPRPFVVFAGGGSVTARGTIFEVALARSGKVDVRLLRGAVDVALPRPSAAAKPTVRKLTAGESVSFAARAPDTARTAAPGNAPAAAPAPAPVVRDFDAVPVTDLIALANRDATRPIRLADTALGAKRVSGRFRIDDTTLLARRLGALFGDDVDQHDPHEIVLGGGGGRSNLP